MDVLCGLVFFILRKFYKAHKYVPWKLEWSKTSVFGPFFCTHFWVQKDGALTEERSRKRSSQSMTGG